MNFSNCIKYSNVFDYSPNGSFIAIAKGNDVLIYQTLDLKYLSRHQLSSKIAQLQFSPDSQFILITLPSIGHCHIRSLEDPQWNCTLSSSPFGITHSLWAPDSRRILTFVNFNLKIDIWSISNNEPNKTIQFPKFSNKAIVFSSNNYFMALAERKEAKDYIGIYFTGDFSLMSHFPVSTVDLQDIIWSKDNTALIVYDNSTECRIFIYSTTGNLLMMNEAYNNCMGVCCACISNNGHYLTFGYGDNCVRLFDYITYKNIAVLNYSKQKHLKEAIILKENKRKFNVVKYSNKLLQKQTWENTFGVFGMEYSFDSMLLAYKCQEIPNAIFIWEISSLTLKTILIFEKTVNSFKWSPNDTKLLIGTDSENIYIYDINTIYLIDLNSPQFSIKDIKWNNDGKSFALTDRNKMIIGFSEIDIEI